MLDSSVYRLSVKYLCPQGLSILSKKGKENEQWHYKEKYTLKEGILEYIFLIHLISVQIIPIYTLKLFDEFLTDKPYFIHTIYIRQSEIRKSKILDWIWGVLDYAIHLFPKRLCGFGEQVQWRALNVFESSVQRQNAISWRELMRISQDGWLTRTRLWV